MLESDEVRARRAARFARDAAAPPPPLPVKKFAHPEGLVVVNKEAAQTFLQKRLEAGLPLTDAQKRALKLVQPQPDQENVQVPSANVMGEVDKARKKKRGPPPASCLVTPSPELPVARKHHAEDSPCFHHLSTSLQYDTGLAGVAPPAGQPDLRVKIEQARAAKVSVPKTAPKTPEIASPPPQSRRAPAETPDWLRQASSFLLHHSPMRTPPVLSPAVPPLEPSVTPPPQLSVLEEAPSAPQEAPIAPPPTSPYMWMGSPATRRNRLFRSANRLPVPSYSPFKVVEMVTSPLKAARQALGRIVDDAPTARRLQVGEEAGADLKPARRKALQPARILLLAVLFLTSSSAWFTFVPSAPSGVVASLRAPPAVAARIGLLSLLGGMRRPRGLEQEDPSCGGSPVCRWSWPSLSCGSKGQCGWRLAWPLGSRWCYEKHALDGDGQSR